MINYQPLVSGQIAIAKAMFEHNRDGLLKTDFSYRETPDLDYIRVCAKDAVAELNEFLKSTETQQSLF